MSMFQPGDKVRLRYHSRFDGQIGEIVECPRRLPVLVDVKFSGYIYSFMPDELELVETGKAG